MVTFFDDFANLSQNNITLQNLNHYERLNRVPNILEIYKVLVQVLFASSKTELDEQHKKLSL